MNKKIFKEKEANNWFNRNKKKLSKKSNDPITNTLINWLKPFKNNINHILEIGCGGGHRLDKFAKTLNAKAYGIDPSSNAINYIKSKFPKINATVAFSDEIPYENEFDLVHLGFFLYLVDRKLYLKSISEIDRLIKFGGFLSIIDFETPYSYTNKYSHQKGVYSHKHSNSDVFISSGLYSLVNRYHFSHNNFYFDKKIDERLSLTLLYKETDIFVPKKK